MTSFTKYMACVTVGLVLAATAAAAPVGCAEENDAVSAARAEAAAIRTQDTVPEVVGSDPYSGGAGELATAEREASMAVRAQEVKEGEAVDPETAVLDRLAKKIDELRQIKLSEVRKHSRKSERETHRKGKKGGDESEGAESEGAEGEGAEKRGAEKQGGKHGREVSKASGGEEPDAAGQEVSVRVEMAGAEPEKDSDAKEFQDKAVKKERAAEEKKREAQAEQRSEELSLNAVSRLATGGGGDRHDFLSAEERNGLADYVRAKQSLAEKEPRMALDTPVRTAGLTASMDRLVGARDYLTPDEAASLAAYVESKGALAEAHSPLLPSVRVAVPDGGDAADLRLHTVTKAAAHTELAHQLLDRMEQEQLALTF
jgi:hypothetical protein